MTLNDLLNMQRELQTHSQQQPETLEQIHLAQLAELGEIVQAVKWGMESANNKYPAWAWWHRSDKPKATRSQVAGEFADLLCFILLELLWIYDAGADEYAKRANQEAVASQDWWLLTWDEDEAIKGEVAFWDFEQVLSNLASFDTSPPDLIISFVWLSKTFGFSQDEIEAAYRDAYNKNVARWADGDNR